MITYHYSLIRYVPDLERMEPINVGIILQGGGRVDFRINTHAANRKVIDTAIFKQWRQFFAEEIHDEPLKLFQPEKGSVQFLHYLAQLCEGSVLLTPPLLWSSSEVVEFDEVLNSLWRRLVLPPESTSPVTATRPTGRFRQIMEKQDFLRRGLQRRTPIVMENERLWRPYRHYENGRLIAIDKVEVNREIDETAKEIDLLPRIVQQLPKFLDGKGSASSEYFLLVDDLQQPFREQQEADFRAMKEDLESAIASVQAKGGRVLRSAMEAENLANRLDAILQPLTPTSGDELRPTSTTLAL